jgi:hypothetical protein
MVLDKALKKAFLDLHGIAYSNDTSVTTLLELSNSFIQWNVSFNTAAHD